ncbi:MAG: dUTP diphosphatase [Pseudomonadota bacterium]
MMDYREVVVQFIREDWADPKVAPPAYASFGAAGADIRANLPEEYRLEGFDIAPMGRRLVPTGLRLSVPQGYELQLRPRSGLALSHGISLINSPGTIDSDFRGALGVLMVNFGTEPFRVTHGSRLAQAVLAPLAQARYLGTERLSETERGEGGFGSTGTG